MMNQCFPLKTAVRFLWQQADGSWREGQGTTRDIGRYGVFVSTDTLPSAGAQIQVIVAMPSTNGSGGQLCGKGIAVRVEERGAKPAGFAAEVLFQSGWASALAQLIPEPVCADDEVPALEPWILPITTDFPLIAAM